MRRNVLISAATLLAFPGCMTLGPLVPKLGAARFAFEDGWGVQGFPFPQETVRNAAAEGMADLKMHSIRPSRAETATVILDAQAHDGRHVRAVIRQAGMNSVVTARVGRFGDQALANALMERIGVRLGTLPPAAIPDEPPTSGGWSPFSRSAVPDSQMLREQADAGYRDTLSPLAPGP